MNGGISTDARARAASGVWYSGLARRRGLGRRGRSEQPLSQASAAGRCLIISLGGSPLGPAAGYLLEDIADDVDDRLTRRGITGVVPIPGSGRRWRPPRFATAIGGTCRGRRLSPADSIEKVGRDLAGGLADRTIEYDLGFLESARHPDGDPFACQGGQERAILAEVSRDRQHQFEVYGPIIEGDRAR